MGLSEFAYMAGHLGVSMAFSLIESVIVLFCMLYLHDSETNKYAYYDNTSAMLLCYVFFIFSCMQSFHVLLLSCFFRNGESLYSSSSSPWRAIRE